MDAVMKILKEIERQAALQAEKQNQAQAEIAEQEVRVRRKRKKEAAAPRPVEPPQPQRQQPSPPPAESPVDVMQSAWTRKRILDALQLNIALGPPPGLDGW